jgi:hypothetical protein
VDWGGLLTLSYKHKHKDIVEVIHTSGKVPIQKQLESACQHGDTQFVEYWLTEGRDGTQDVDWGVLLQIACKHKQQNIVNIMHTSTHVSVQALLSAACRSGDEMLVNGYLSLDIDYDKILDWGELLHTACRHKHTNIVDVIGKQQKLSLHEQLYAACWTGDLAFVQDCLVAEFKQLDDDIFWEYLLLTAHKCEHKDIVQRIEESKNVSKHNKPVYVWKYGTPELAHSHLGNSASDMVEEWEKDLFNAYRRMNHNILSIIIQGGRALLQRTLESVCECGDLTQAQSWMSAIGKADLGIDWGRLLDIANESGHRNIAMFIAKHG